MKSHLSRKIVLVIASLGAGGAERVMSMLATEWVKRGNHVTLITLDDIGRDHYPLPPDVKRVGLAVLGASMGKLDALQRNLSRLGKLRAAIKAESPDVVISFMDATNVLTLLATSGLKVPVVVSERIDPSHYSIATGWNWLRKKLYPRASTVVVQTESIASWARGIVKRDKVEIIPNPVQVLPPPHSEADAALVPGVPAEVFEKPFILAVGRLHEQKGLDLLLAAFAAIPPEEDARLVILGEGPEREALTAQAEELGIGDRVYMPGRVANPFPVLARAGIYVLSSRFEGFPNALLEAMAAGLPVVSFNCPSGPGHIINNGVDGILVEAENTEKLCEAMTFLLRDPELRKRLGREAKKSTTKYSLDSITNKWERLFTAGGRTAGKVEGEP
jgi:glycosyltransferase involved in cell wall biosynthesis